MLLLIRFQSFFLFLYCFYCLSRAWAHTEWIETIAISKRKKNINSKYNRKKMKENIKSWLNEEEKKLENCELLCKRTHTHKSHRTYHRNNTNQIQKKKKKQSNSKIVRKPNMQIGQIWSVIDYTVNKIPAIPIKVDSLWPMQNTT